MSNNIKYAIAIDAGGSKTEARLTCLTTNKSWQLKVGAASLSHDLTLACERIKGIADSLVQQAKKQQENIESRNCIIACGAAGAGCYKNSQMLSHYLKNDYPQNYIISDAKTSLFGAGNGQAILVVAIGTGSVAMRLDDKGHEKMFGGWGFIAGDLGSGSDMGKQLVTRMLVQLDQSPDHLEPLLQRTLESLGLVNDKKLALEVDRQDLLNWLKNATPTSYAAIAPLLFEYRESNTAKRIIRSAAQSINELIEISQPDALLPVAIIGGLAKAITPYLSDNIQQNIIQAKGDALDGALYLALNKY